MKTMNHANKTVVHLLQRYPSKEDQSVAARHTWRKSRAKDTAKTVVTARPDV